MRRSLSTALAVVIAGVALFAAWKSGMWRRVESAGPQLPVALEIRAAAKASYSPTIRVNLTPAPVQQLKLRVQRACRVHPLGSDRVLHQLQPEMDVQIAATAAGFRIGKREVRAARLEITPEESPAIWVDKHKYRGTVRLFHRPGNKFIAVNAVPLEDYVASVVDGEMPAAFPDAARRAQAIAARTYALYQMSQADKDAQFDVFATTKSQKYLGAEYLDSSGRRLAGDSPSSRQAVADTAGMVCTYHGRLFCTYYSATCGGATVTGSHVFADAAPPLKSVPCNWCRDSDLYRWSTQIDVATASGHLKEYFAESSRPFDALASIAPRPTPAGATPSFDVSDGKNRYAISAAALRRRLPAGTLPSPLFSARVAGKQVVFEGRGHGHGVGVCQWGARGQALAGKNTLDILRYYYPGSQVVALKPAAGQRRAERDSSAAAVVTP